MAIISVSLNDKILQDIDLLQREMGFSGRSEIFRAGARLLIEDYKSKKELKGMISSVLILLHDKHIEDMIIEVKHNFEDIIDTQIHNHTVEDKCLDIFILKGDASRIKDLTTIFQSQGHMDYIKLVVP